MRRRRKPVYRAVIFDFCMAGFGIFKISAGGGIGQNHFLAAPQKQIVETLTICRILRGAKSAVAIEAIVQDRH
jgi:hypothetical protein